MFLKYICQLLGNMKTTYSQPWLKWPYNMNGVDDLSDMDESNADMNFVDKIFYDNHNV